MQAIILAAGESSRFWPLNQKHKSLFKIMGRPLIFYLLKELKKAGLKEVIVVQKPNRDVERELKNLPFSQLKITYTIQKKPTGTGDAVLTAEDFIKDKFLVLNAERVDCGKWVKEVIKKGGKEKKTAVLLSAPTTTPWLFGNLKIKGDKVLDVVEKPKKGKEFTNLKTVGLYLFPKEALFFLKRFTKNPYSLIEILKTFAKKGDLKWVKMKKESLHLKYPWNLFDYAEHFSQALKLKILGKVERGAQTKEKVFLGKNTLVKKGTLIEGPVYIGENCQIGPNCYIRGTTFIEDNCKIGNGVEIKNSIIGAGTKISHLSYIGDSILGEECNIGAGTISANLRFDGKEIRVLVKGEKISTAFQKLGAIVGAGSQIGINTSLMPGVLVGRDCWIGPHSFVSENIKDKSIFYNKFQKIIKKRR